MRVIIVLLAVFLLAAFVSAQQQQTLAEAEQFGQQAQQRLDQEIASHVNSVFNSVESDSEFLRKLWRKHGKQLVNNNRDKIEQAVNGFVNKQLDKRVGRLPADFQEPAREVVNERVNRGLDRVFDRINRNNEQAGRKGSARIVDRMYRREQQQRNAAREQGMDDAVFAVQQQSDADSEFLRRLFNRFNAKRVERQTDSGINTVVQQDDAEDRVMADVEALFLKKLKRKAQKVWKKHGAKLIQKGREFLSQNRDKILNRARDFINRNVKNDRVRDFANRNLDRGFDRIVNGRNNMQGLSDAEVESLFLKKLGRKLKKAWKNNKDKIFNAAKSWLSQNRDKVLAKAHEFVDRNIKNEKVRGIVDRNLDTAFDRLLQRTASSPAAHGLSDAEVEVLFLKKLGRKIKKAWKNNKGKIFNAAKNWLSQNRGKVEAGIRRFVDRNIKNDKVRQIVDRNLDRVVDRAYERINTPSQGAEGLADSDRFRDMIARLRERSRQFRPIQRPIRPAQPIRDVIQPAEIEEVVQRVKARVQQKRGELGLPTRTSRLTPEQKAALKERVKPIIAEYIAKRKAGMPAIPVATEQPEADEELRARPETPDQWFKALFARMRGKRQEPVELTPRG